QPAVLLFFRRPGELANVRAGEERAALAEQHDRLQILATGELRERAEEPLANRGGDRADRRFVDCDHTDGGLGGNRDHAFAHVFVSVSVSSRLSNWSRRRRPRRRSSRASCSTWYLRARASSALPFAVRCSAQQRRSPATGLRTMRPRRSNLFTREQKLGFWMPSAQPTS